MSENSSVTVQVLEQGTHFQGILRSQSPVVVWGQLVGELTAPALTLMAEGSVHAKMKVSHLKSEGVLGGEIDAESVQLSGSISDDTVIRASAIEVKLNQPGDGKMRVSFGNCELQVGEVAAKAEAEVRQETQHEPAPEFARVDW